MSYVLIGGAVLLACVAVYRYLRGVDRRALMRVLRWLVGGGAAVLAALLLVARRFDLAVFAGAAAFSIWRTGRLGPFTFEAGPSSSPNVSKVRSRYFAMSLDHDTGAVEGRVLTGRFAGVDLMQLGEAETRELLVEIANDPDSSTLLESWLDANRAGWREYFAETASGGDKTDTDAAPGSLAEAYQVLGLKPGATDDEIKAAHRELMKTVHPDHGGSAYLAAKVNEARDLLLGRSGS